MAPADRPAPLEVASAATREWAEWPRSSIRVSPAAHQRLHKLEWAFNALLVWVAVAAGAAAHLWPPAAVAAAGAMALLVARLVNNTRHSRVDATLWDSLPAPAHRSLRRAPTPRPQVDTLHYDGALDASHTHVEMDVWARMGRLEVGAGALIPPHFKSQLLLKVWPLTQGVIGAPVIEVQGASGAFGVCELGLSGMHRVYVGLVPAPSPGQQCPYTVSISRTVWPEDLEGGKEVGWLELAQHTEKGAPRRWRKR